MHMQLTEHFTVEALCASSVAERRGWDNLAPRELWVNGQRTAEGLERVMVVLGYPLHHDSGYRCEELERFLSAKDFMSWCEKHNKAPGSSWNEYFLRKQHPKFQAEDFTCPQFGTPREIVDKIAGSDIVFDQLIEEGTWVHISFSDAPRQRREVITATFVNGVPNYRST